MQVTISKLKIPYMAPFKIPESILIKDDGGSKTTNDDKFQTDMNGTTNSD